MSITLTRSAAVALTEFIKANSLDPSTVFVRVAVKGGGCSGFSYAFDLTDTQKTTDEAFQSEGMTILIDPKSLLYLNGLVIDYKATMMQSGFVFQNPNATSKCGCGSSFSA